MNRREDDGLTQTVENIVRRLSPAGRRAVDIACDGILPALEATGDPRATNIVRALQLGCRLRSQQQRR